MEAAVDSLTPTKIPKAASLSKKIDRLNEVIGKLISFLVIPLTFIITYEVISRYVFNSPTIWSWDICMYLGGLIVIIGGGYAHLHKAHVNVEVFLERMSLKSRALLDMILSPFIVIPLVILVWYGWEAAWVSIKINEHHSSLWEPPIYYLRLAIPLGGILFLLQEISNFIKNLAVYMKPMRPADNGGGV